MSETHPPAPSGHTHETSDARPRPILEYGVGLVVFVVAALVVMAWMFSYFTQREARLDDTASPLAEGPLLPPEPRLQASPAVELQDLRAREDAQLNTFGWVDEEQGLVRIPIDKAIDVLVERGLPARAEQENESNRAEQGE